MTTTPGSSARPESACGCQGRERPLIADVFTIHTMAMRIGDRISRSLGLTSSRWLLLCHLKNVGESPTVGALSNEANLSVQNVSRMLNAMEEEGIVRRSPCPDDARKCVVELTEKGERAAAAFDALGDRFHEEFLRGFDDARAARLKSDLADLVTNLKRIEAELDADGVSGWEHDDGESGRDGE